MEFKATNLRLPKQLFERVEQLLESFREDPDYACTPHLATAFVLRQAVARGLDVLEDEQGIDPGWRRGKDPTVLQRFLRALVGGGWLNRREIMQRGQLNAWQIGRVLAYKVGMLAEVRRRSGAGKEYRITDRGWSAITRDPELAPAAPVLGALDTLGVEAMEGMGWMPIEDIISTSSSAVDLVTCRECLEVLVKCELVLHDPSAGSWMITEAGRRLAAEFASQDASACG
jgi:hypothetical protein